MGWVHFCFLKIGGWVSSAPRRQCSRTCSTGTGTTSPCTPGRSRLSGCSPSSSARFGAAFALAFRCLPFHRPFHLPFSTVPQPVHCPSTAFPLPPTTFHHCPPTALPTTTLHHRRPPPPLPQVWGFVLNGVDFETDPTKLWVIKDSVPPLPSPGVFAAFLPGLAASTLLRSAALCCAVYSVIRSTAADLRAPARCRCASSAQPATAWPTALGPGGVALFRSSALAPPGSTDAS